MTRRLPLAIALLGALCTLSLPATAQENLTDEELLDLFVKQRDAFRAARASGNGQTRGLTLVTVETLTGTGVASAATEAAEVADTATETITGTETAATDAATTADSTTDTTTTTTTADAGTETGTDSDDTVVATTTTGTTETADTADTIAVASAETGVFGVLDPGLQVNVNVKFGFDSAALTPDQKPVLAQLCTVMRQSDIELFQIVGHTDAAGTDEYNLKLSQLRAEEVQRYFVNDCGIEAARLKAVGMGEQFLADQADPRGPENRRVEFQALS